MGITYGWNSMYCTLWHPFVLKVSSPAPQPAAQQSKSDVNASTVCRIGQETVEEIVSRTQEVFSILKSLQPPVGSYNPQTVAHDKSNQEKQNRLQDVLKGIGMLFKRLRVCWEKCQVANQNFFGFKVMTGYFRRTLVVWTSCRLSL